MCYHPLFLSRFTMRPPVIIHCTRQRFSEIASTELAIHLFYFCSCFQLENLQNLHIFLNGYLITL